MDNSISRRDLLRGAAALSLGAASAPLLSACSNGKGKSSPSTAQPRSTTSTTAPIRKPGSRPDPTKPEGTDTIPQIEHIIVVMMENHSFDNYFGMLGRGDGFSLRDGRPANTNPDGKGKFVRAFRMPSSCQPGGMGPSQNWNSSHTAFAAGKMDGFVKASGPIAMGYWTGEDLPYYYALARTFPLCDRWFCSVLAQTYPNRRFLLAGTAAGLVSTDILKIATGPEPPNGSIFERLDAHHISWNSYTYDLPQVALFPSVYKANPDKHPPIAQYFTDAANGTLASVSLVDPKAVGEGSEENGDIHLGEDLVQRVVDAAMHGPKWDKTLLIWLYDEHGGYYDHVVPPPAIAPDDIPPDIKSSDIQARYDRYGFRVPAVVVSPYARKDYVSHVVHDHTSVLKFIETKWNLPALTYRDANADDLLDCLDFESAPAFLEPPDFPESALAAGATCTAPPRSAIPPADAILATAAG